MALPLAKGKAKELFYGLLKENIQYNDQTQKRDEEYTDAYNMDKMLLFKGTLIETVTSRIKFLGKFEHSRHRSHINVFSYMIALSCKISVTWR